MNNLLKTDAILTRAETRIASGYTSGLIGKEIADCDRCRAGRAVLTDRKGMKFPVLSCFGHRSLIFNSVPVYMADRKSELSRAGVRHEHFIFSDETEAEIQNVIRAYRLGLAPDGSVRRIR